MNSFIADHTKVSSSKGMDFKDVYSSNGTLKYLKIRFIIIPYGKATLKSLGRRERSKTFGKI